MQHAPVEFATARCPNFGLGQQSSDSVPELAWQEEVE